MRKFTVVFFTLLMIGNLPVNSQQDAERYVTEQSTRKAFSLAENGNVAPILVSSSDHEGVIRVAADLQNDLLKVTGTRPGLVILDEGQDPLSAGYEEFILVGTLGKSPPVDRLVKEGRLQAEELEGKWESSVTQVVEKPFPGVRRALVICGSDKRGTIYGVYELSSQAGVSPWYYWADVTPPHRVELYVTGGIHRLMEPAVKYRGIFINDEAPALSGWAEEQFGGFNHQFYAHVFELILRMKGNYLWPAMWGRAFYDDDSLNAPMADTYGVVIGTTHHEPLMRAHDEWARYGEGPWDYQKNSERLREFWREGIRRMDSYESIVSVGMRGDGDEPMTQGTAIELLETIVSDQRKIIEEVKGKPAEETPQLWALYKEVQDYYDKGMRVPDDVTLLLCDDNWGNLRMLPQAGDPERTGGYGIYYHFDYVGGPRNYKWLNTNQIERVWEQMHLAYEYGVDRIWIVNVGDIKPMELPTQFFLDMAWDPDRWNPGNIHNYYMEWARQQFGEEHAEEIAGILADYTRYNARRKPELLSPATYSLDHYREAERVVATYRELEAEAQNVFHEIPSELKDAYDQLVLFPVSACANLNDLYVTAARNKRYAEQERSATNLMAARARELFLKDSLLTVHFHRDISGGKWNRMMSQTHIGYTYWQQPDHNNMPELSEITLPEKAVMGVAIEGSDQAWPESPEDAKLPVADALNRQAYYLEVFNRGTVPFVCTVDPSEKWVIPSQETAEIGLEERIYLEVDWEQVPEGMHTVPVRINGPEGTSVTVLARIDNRPLPAGSLQQGIFVPGNGTISMEAASYHRAMDDRTVRWEEIPNLGRTRSSMITLPETAPSGIPGGDDPHLEYMFLARDTGAVTIHTFLSPTLDFHRKGGLEFAVSVDNGPPVRINMHQPDRPYLWNRWVSDNIIEKSTEYPIRIPGVHTLKWWRIDPAVVLQKIVITPGKGTVDGYLGPPESKKLEP